MNHQIVRNSLIISAAVTLAAATAYGAEPTARFDRATFQAELNPLSVDARAQAATVGREVADRALTVTHCVTLQPHLKSAASHSAQPERS